MAHTPKRLLDSFSDENLSKTYRTSHFNVHFAGTATSVEWCGYFSGAVQSGYRASAEVLKNLYPDALSEMDLKLIEDAHPLREYP